MKTYEDIVKHEDKHWFTTNNREMCSEKDFLTSLGLMITQGLSKPTVHYSNSILIQLEEINIDDLWINLGGKI